MSLVVCKGSQRDTIISLVFCRGRVTSDIIMSLVVCRGRVTSDTIMSLVVCNGVTKRHYYVSSCL